MSKYTAEQLKSLSSGELVVLVLSMQDQLDRLIRRGSRTSKASCRCSMRSRQPAT